MKILYVSAEVAPFAKVGGLADVAGSLPKALHALGHDVRILMPSYKLAEDALGKDLTRRIDDFEVAINPSWSKTAYLNEGAIDGVPVYMVGTDEWFNSATSSETIYSPGVDAYLFLSSVALQLPDLLGWTPDVVHANDWHAGFIPVLMRERSPWKWDQSASVFTIHNLAYQGEFGVDILDKLGLAHSLFNMNQLEFFGSVNFLKAGCVYADQVNTVSPTYSYEIQDPEYGCHMEGLMMHLAHQGRLSGILNGIDDRHFNPATDPSIPARFDADNSQGKAACKSELLKKLNMEPIQGAPLLGAVTRLSDQKGMNLLLRAAPAIFDMPCQVVVQGLGDPWLSDSFAALEKQYPKHFRYVNAFDVSMAQQVYAGCDAFLMPSLFEPCGLGQMIAMRYGTLPIVRKTGGLCDTVHEERNGFSFTAKTSDALLAAVRRAHSTYANPAEWTRLQQAAMRGDFSWSSSAREYVALYEKALAHRRAVAQSA